MVMTCNNSYKTLIISPLCVQNYKVVPINTNINYTSKSSSSFSTTKAILTSRHVSGEKTNGKFGSFGGKFVAEVLVTPLQQLESEFNSVLLDHEFQMEVATALRDYVGRRETPLYHAQKLTDHCKNMNNGEGPEIYIKREDLNQGGSYKMNNVVAQAILAKRMGHKSVITATSVES